MSPTFAQLHMNFFSINTLPVATLLPESKSSITPMRWWSQSSRSLIHRPIPFFTAGLRQNYRLRQNHRLLCFAPEKSSVFQETQPSSPESPSPDAIRTADEYFQVYVVYLGEHRETKTFEEIEEIHHSYLHSVKFSKEEAKNCIIYSYKNFINGFSALLTPEEAITLSGMDGVISVFHCHPTKLRLHMTQENSQEAIEILVNFEE